MIMHLDMPRIDLLIVPSLRASAAKAAEVLTSLNYRALFLNLPSNLQYLISEYALGNISLQEMLYKIESMRLIPEPVGSWLYLNEPLIEALKKLKKSVKVYCYRDVDYHHMLTEASVKIASLALRVSVTNRVNVEEWIRILKGCCRPEILEREAEFISFKTEDKSLCITSLSGFSIAKKLRKLGHRVKVRCVERLYCFKPIEILEAMLEKGKVSYEAAEGLIREHVEFIKDHVLTSKDPDEAYYSWLHEKRNIKLISRISICP